MRAKSGAALRGVSEKPEELRRLLRHRDQDAIQLLAAELLAMRQPSHIARQILHLAARNRYAEVLPGDVLHLVGFVENHGGIVGDDRAALVFLHREIGEEQMVIDDDQVAFAGLLVHARDEAALELRALLAAAQLAARVHLGPCRAVLRQALDLRAIARFGGLLPGLNDLKIGDLFQSRQHGLFFGIVDLLAAGVVGAALHVAGAQRAQVFLQERNVLEEKLFLEIFRSRGNDDALPGENRGNQIRQSLAGSRAGFDDQVFLVGQRAFHGFRHVELALAVFVTGVPLGKQSFTAKELADGESFGGCSHLLDDSTSGWKPLRRISRMPAPT